MLLLRLLSEHHLNRFSDRSADDSFQEERKDSKGMIATTVSLFLYALRIEYLVLQNPTGPYVSSYTNSTTMLLYPFVSSV
jgi:hypothetical protein